VTGGEPNLRFSNPPEPATPPGYTHVVEATGGRAIYIAGQVARNRSGDVVGPGDMAAQTRQVFENLKAALESVGAGFGDVVKLNYYLTDISQIGAVREVRDEYLDTQRPPASTVVEVRRLVQEEFLIEVEAVARS
jgi:enamine deaminase RidA (YjgF/YER057c/UK114 family)